MVGQSLHWQRLTVTAALISGTCLINTGLEERGFRPAIAIAQDTETLETAGTATDNNRGFLQGLLQLNQDFLANQEQLRRLATELEAIDRNRQAFNAAFFEEYLERLTTLQQQINALDSQLGQFDTEQQLVVKAELEALQSTVQNIQAIATPFAAGFNPESIRTVQEFLDFFEAQNLPESSYGFYGTVTQTEVNNYLNQQLADLRNTLKQLNQAATKGAIAPDLATSINYLYTTLSLDNTVNPDDGSNFQQTIERLEAENEILNQRVQNTHRIILFLPLIVMLPTTILVFVLFYYFGKIFQEKSRQPVNYQFSINDIYGLEDELIARLSQRYDLKPKLLKRRNDPFAEKLISLATGSKEGQTFIEEDIAEEITEQVGEQTNPPEKTIDPDAILDGEWSEEDEDDDNFPVHLPNIYDELVDRYNKDARYLEAEAIALEISHEESYLDDETEFMPMLLLQEEEAGEYWATEFKSIDYLVPKADLSITDENYASFKNVFICYGYQPDTVQKVKLLKPARASRAETEKTWELVQQGIVVLHRI